MDLAEMVHSTDTSAIIPEMTSKVEMEVEGFLQRRVS